jgi:hypothetical protein
MNMKRTLIRGSLFLAAAALATSGLIATPANAAAAQQTCKTLKGTVNIKPGISATPRAQTATAKGNLGGCAPAAKTGGTGVMTATLKLPANSSCGGLASGGTTIKMTTKITWKNKKTSTLALTAKTGTGSNVLTATITGKVTAGLFKGRPVTAQIKIKPTKGNCAPTPVTQLSFQQSKPFVIK